MALDERKIEDLVERVMARMARGSGAAAVRPSTGAHMTSPGSHTSAKGGKGASIPRGTLGAYDSPDAVVAAAQRGFEQSEATPTAVRVKMIQAMRDVIRANIRDLSAYAVEETGLGRYEDKLVKNALVADKTPGVEILRPIAYTGDDGLTLTERAPYGVILAITPCTNPTETILCNAIGMLAGGNAVIFNVHPSAKRVSAWAIHLLNQAIAGVGGPRDAISFIADPTIESAQALMTHPGVRLLTVTGGGAVVKTAMHAGKRTIAAGPGNPPALVDETANLDIAAKGITDGASVDNNIVCIAEKEIIAVASIADALRDRMVRTQPVVLLNDRQVRELEKVILDGDHVNKEFVGKNAGTIAKQIGLSVGDDVRLLLCEVDEKHPFIQHELLMPVLGMMRVPDVAEGIAAAKRVEHGFCHTSTMYSTNIDHMAAMARVVNTSIFVKNAPSLAGLGLGGEGYTSFTIASPTGEGLTTAVHFTRERRCTLKEAFRFV